MGKTSSTRKLRLFYILYLLQKHTALTTEELKDFNQIKPRSLYRELQWLMKHDYIFFQVKQYKLTAKGKKITFLHELSV